MRINIGFLAPDGPYFRKKTAASAAPAQVSLDKQGRVLFNAPAARQLDLKRGGRVLLGADLATPHDWYVSLDSAGFELKSAGPSGAVLFYSQPLYEALLKSLPYAPPGQTLRLLLDTHSLATDEGEVWALLTVPYCHPPAPAQTAQRTLVRAPSGFLGIRKSAELYG